jgi:hypothetical protein
MKEINGWREYVIILLYKFGRDALPLKKKLERFIIWDGMNKCQMVALEFGQGCLETLLPTNTF